MSLIHSLDLQAIVDAKTDEELIFGLSDAESLQNTPYAQLEQLRRLAFPRLAAQIADPDGLMSAWATRMAESTESDTVVLKPGTPFAYRLPWLAAFAVVWKGEAPSHWPAEWTDEHITRALAWESGANIPGVVSGKNTLGATMT